MPQIALSCKNRFHTRGSRAQRSALHACLHNHLRAKIPLLLLRAPQYLSQGGPQSGKAQPASLLLMLCGERGSWLLNWARRRGLSACWLWSISPHWLLTCAWCHLYARWKNTFKCFLVKSNLMKNLPGTICITLLC